MATQIGLSITALTGPLSGQRIGLSGTGLVIGRHDADLTVPDDEVSRRHAVLRPVPGGVEIADLGSLNGTWVDGARIAAPVVVGNGARLRVGTTTFVLSVGSALAVGSDGQTVAAASLPPPDPFVPPPPPRTRRPGSVATRLWIPAVLSFAAILATAVALLLYFSLR